MNLTSMFESMELIAQNYVCLYLATSVPVPLERIEYWAGNVCMAMPETRLVYTQRGIDYYLIDAPNLLCSVEV